MKKAVFLVSLIAVTIIFTGCGSDIRPVTDNQVREHYPDYDNYTLSVKVMVNGSEAKPVGAQYLMKTGDQIELVPVWSGIAGTAAPPSISYETGVQDEGIALKTGDTTFIARHSGETVLYLRAHRDDPFGWGNNVPIKVY